MAVAAQKVRRSTIELRVPGADQKARGSPEEGRERGISTIQKILAKAK